MLRLPLSALRPARRCRATDRSACTPGDCRGCPRLARHLGTLPLMATTPPNLR